MFTFWEVWIFGVILILRSKFNLNFYGISMNWQLWRHQSWWIRNFQSLQSNTMFSNTYLNIVLIFRSKLNHKIHTIINFRRPYNNKYLLEANLGFSEQLEFFVVNLMCNHLHMYVYSHQIFGAFRFRFFTKYFEPLHRITLIFGLMHTLKCLSIFLRVQWEFQLFKNIIFRSGSEKSRNTPKFHFYYEIFFRFILPLNIT